MSSPVVDVLQAYFQDQGLTTIGEFIEEYGHQRIKDFLGGCWAVRDLADVLGEFVDADGITEDEADVMWTELEADLETGMEALGLKRTTPIC